MKDAVYVRQRKKFLKEMNSLLIQRAEVNKQIRKLQSEMSGYDRVLVQ